jgi:hypothetical protein
MGSLNTEILAELENSCERTCNLEAINMETHALLWKFNV